MTVTTCTIPLSSALSRELVDTAWFKDSYRAPLSTAGASPADLFVAIFCHHPPWMKAVLILRNRLASWGGLAAPIAAEILQPQSKSTVGVGDVIGVWPIHLLGERELIAGRDNHHLDFRVSVLRERVGAAEQVVVSTVCSVHNRFGKVYLFVIAPFHRWGVRLLIERAVRAGRI